jgi:putative flippase GtrA
MNNTGKQAGSYFLVSFTQTFVEFGAFAFLQLLKLPAPVPGAVSVFISGCWNYMLNRNITFKSSANYLKSITQFILLMGNIQVLGGSREMFSMIIHI